MNKNTGSAKNTVYEMKVVENDTLWHIKLEQTLENQFQHSKKSLHAEEFLLYKLLLAGF